MKSEYLPEHWQKWLSSRPKGRLLAEDFSAKIQLHFGDGSYAFFDYAFAVLDVSRQEVAVFTEHCGYHIFSARGLEVTPLDWQDAGAFSKANLKNTDEP